MIHCPGHTPDHVIFHHEPSKLALVGDVLFQGSIGHAIFRAVAAADLIASITRKLWPLGGDTAFVPGHGAMSTFAHERAEQPMSGIRWSGDSLSRLATGRPADVRRPAPAGLTNYCPVPSLVTLVIVPSRVT